MYKDGQGHICLDSEYEENKKSALVWIIHAMALQFLLLLNRQGVPKGKICSV